MLIAHVIVCLTPCQGIFQQHGINVKEWVGLALTIERATDKQLSSSGGHAGHESGDASLGRHKAPSSAGHPASTAAEDNDPLMMSGSLLRGRQNAR